MPTGTRATCRSRVARAAALAEAASAIVDAGLISERALQDGLLEMQRVAADDTIVAVMPRVAQVNAVKVAA